ARPLPPPGEANPAAPAAAAATGSVADTAAAGILRPQGLLATRDARGRRGVRGAGEALGWALLGALLLATLAAALTFDPAGRPALIGDAATYAGQAASLAPGA